MDPTTARERRWWNQLHCGNAEASAEACFALSSILGERDRAEEAEAILRQCAQAQSNAIAAAAMIRLAQLIERRLGPAAAEPAYEEAADMASPLEGADVLIDLAGRWAARGELKRAARAYRAVADRSSDAQMRTVAGYRLGVLQRESGHLCSAIDSWDAVLGEARAPLRIHLLVDLAEARLEQAEGDPTVTVALLTEAVESDHPDLAPRAALRLAQLKRGTGEFIEAYRLAQLVVDSLHPVFAPEGEAERELLINGELDSLLEVQAQQPQQLQLTEDAWDDQPMRRLYIPLISTELFHPARREWDFGDGEQGTDGGGEIANSQLHSGCNDLHRASGVAAGAFLWKAYLGKLEKSDLRAMKTAIAGEGRRIVEARPYGGPRAQPLDLPTICGTSPPSSRPDRDLEFLILLRAVVWLRVEATPLRFRLIFDQASQRLAKLLDDGGELRDHSQLPVLTLACVAVGQHLDGDGVRDPLRSKEAVDGWCPPGCGPAAVRLWEPFGLARAPALSHW